MSARSWGRWATGFKTVEEAIQLRNRVLECLDIAESTQSPAIRERNDNAGGGTTSVTDLPGCGTVTSGG